MKFLLLLVATAGLTAYAAAPTLEESVANDISALLSDTVNEGDQQAHVAETDGKPVVSCRVSNAREHGKKWAFCKVLFDLTYEGSKGQRECHLLYSFVPGELPASLVADQAKEDECIEALSESIE